MDNRNRMIWTIMLAVAVIGIIVAAGFGAWTLLV